jgi:hypothetical protein
VTVTADRPPATGEAGTATDSALLLRRGLLVLAGLGIAGTAVELAMLRHWKSFEQLIPWAALAVIALCLAAVAFRPTRATVLVARFGGLALVIAGLYGALEHVSGNLGAGPLDAVYGPRWDSMGTLARWWHALSGSVGPAPVLAPLILAQIALCLLLATVHHPVLRRPGRDASAAREGRTDR